MKALKKALIIFSVSVATLSLLALVFSIGLTVYISKNIDFSTDEAMFELAGRWEATVFYAPRDTASDVYEPVEIDTGDGLKKLYCRLDEVSDYLVRGFIAVEDRKFETHHGVDTARMLAAAYNYLFGGKKRFGASTITQQVIKNVSGDNELTLKRKLSEIIRALHIESEYSKDEILEVYLNVIPMGENMYGVEIASRTYFGKAPSELSAAEAATLIGITNAPTAYNPYLHPDQCLKKRNLVLSVMHSEGVIDTDEYNAAVASALTVLPRDTGGAIDSWFVETVIDDASADLAEKYGITKSAARLRLLGGGYRIYTTEDMRIQSILESYFSDTENLPKEVDDGLELAMTVMSNSGELRGVIGRVGEKRADRLLNHATACHTPGSVLKPIALYAPLIEENRISPATVFDDVPVSFTKNGDEYREFPRNSPNIYSGLITVKDAIRLSKNTVAVRLCQMRGLKSIFNGLKNDFGFDTLVESRDDGSGGRVTDLAVSPLALGQLTDGVSLMKLTSAYTVFPSGGVLNGYRSYLLIEDYSGKTVIEKGNGGKRIFSEDTAELMNQLLKGVVENGTASRISLGSAVDTAGKTGTSGDNRDRLFIGYTPYLTAGIWCGYDDGTRSLGALSPSHLDIWDEIMQKIHGGKYPYREFSTANLTKKSYCRDSGKAATDSCRLDPRGAREESFFFKRSHTPTGVCDRHIEVAYDTVGKGVATPLCPLVNLTRVALIRVIDRKFPTEIYVTDAEFVYRDSRGYDTLFSDPARPYFAPSLPSGEYVGVSKKRRQFNTACPSHTCDGKCD